jgi:hypothetical protein
MIAPAMTLFRTARPALAATLIAFCSPALAEHDPQPVFCGGLVTVKNDNPQLLGERVRPDGTRDIIRSVVKVSSVKGTCPAAAKDVTIPNGIGASGSQPSLPVADAFDPSGERTLYKRIPEGSVEAYGVLGQELQAIFQSRAAIEMRSNIMRTNLQELRSFSGSFTTGLRQQYDQYRATLPGLKSQLSNDAAGQRAKLDARSPVDAAIANNARDRLRDLVNNGSLTIPTGAIGGLAPLLNSRARSAAIESQIPPQNLRPPGLGKPSILGALDSYRWSQYTAPTAAGRDIQFETAKLDTDIARAGDSANGRAVKSYQNAREALALAREFSTSDSPAAAAITAALLDQARSYRYAADGRARQASVALLTASGVPQWETVDPDADLPPTSIVQNARTYSRSKALFGVQESAVKNGLQSRPLDEKLNSGLLLGYADSLAARADAEYSAGNIAEAEKLLDHSNDVVIHVRDGETGWDAALNAENKVEVDEFKKSLTGATADAAEDKFTDFLGDSYLKIANFGMVTGPLRDFIGLSAAVANQAISPSDENYAKCAELGLKFAVGVNAGAVAALVATFVGLTPVGAIVLGIGFAVAGDYAVRAMIASSAYTGPRAKGHR